MWHGANDYAQGIFREPYFYGQNYNFMLESLVAVPFVWLGIPLHWALPLSTILLATFPFLLFAIVLFKRKHYTSAYIFLSLPILLSVEYDVITSISRGFINGIFFLSFLIYPILEPSRNRSFVLFGIAASFAFVFNPNTVIFSLPVGIYLLIKNVKNYQFYLFVIASAIPAMLIQYWAKSFYLDNPEYHLHSMWELLFKWKWIGEAFNYLDLFFRGLTPVFWSGNWFILVILLLLSFALFRKNKLHAGIIFLSVAFIVLTFGINKVHDDKDWIFFSSARMFLAVPLLLGLAIHWILDENQKTNKWWMYSLTILICATFAVKHWDYPKHIQDLNPSKELNNFYVSSIDQLEDDCGQISPYLNQYNVDLVVFIPHWSHSAAHTQLLNYGCPFIDTKMQSTVLSLYERRTWTYEEAISKSYKTVLLYGYNLSNQPAIEENENIKLLRQGPDIVVIQNNTAPIPELIAQFNMEFKRK